MSTGERSYYENDAVWRADFSADPEERARLDATVAAIPAGTTSLLDVGCGNGAFLHAAMARVPEVHGVDRSETALGYVRVPHTSASADRLPFADRSFDVVSCLEVIEHLPVDIYEAALRELARVARRHLLIGVPWQEDTAADRVTCPGCHCLFNRSYHLRSFDDETLRTLWSSRGLGFALESIAPLGHRPVYPGLQLARRLAEPFRQPRLPSGVVCPQCGEQGPPPSTTTSTGGAAATSRLRALWPKTTQPRWYLARYRREGP
jgi:SAM-dependent methyltransferase